MLLEPHSGLIAWTIITFLVVFVILKKAVWKPVLRALDDREKGIRDALERAERARDEAQAAGEEHRKVLAGAEAEARQIVARAREAAENVGATIVEEARTEAQQTVEQARRSIDSEKRAALTELRREMADLAVQAAGAIIDANLDDDRNRKLVNDLIAGVPQRPGN